jgi:hypothetical protein
MMALPMLLLFGTDREAVALMACCAILGIWWAFLAWSIWAGVSALVAVLP